ncbi:MAG: hypothetical protein IJ071_12765 [Ruminococcus sp.]|nr:hypothetical protein [Ruminococcus sp.]
MKKLSSRIAAIFLCLLSVAVILTASGYIADHAGHDCSGEDCAVCHVISDLSRTVSALGAAGASAAAAAAALFFAYNTAVTKRRPVCFATPVTLRQRLLN